MLITLPNGNLADPRTITNIRFFPREKWGTTAFPDRVVVCHRRQESIPYESAEDAIKARDDLGRAVQEALAAEEAGSRRELSPDEWAAFKELTREAESRREWGASLLKHPLFNLLGGPATPAESREQRPDPDEADPESWRDRGPLL